MMTPSQNQSQSPSCFPLLRVAGAVLAVSLLLAGCSNLSRSTSTVAIYDFGPAPARAAAAKPWRLALDVRMPSWYEALAVDYRLDYDDPLLQRAYGNSRWAAAPGDMIARQLRRQLGLNEAGVAAGCLLRVEVDEFVQVFSSPQHSRGVLSAVVFVSDVSRRPLASTALHIEQPAVTADARGGVRALVDTANALGERIDAWLTGIDRDGRLNPCLAPAN